MSCGRITIKPTTLRRLLDERDGVEKAERYIEKFLEEHEGHKCRDGTTVHGSCFDEIESIAGHGFMCGTGVETCLYCPRVSTKLCDGMITRKRKRQLCSAPICDGCARSVGCDLDLCPVHAAMYAASGTDLEQPEKVSEKCLKEK